jgi:hypothetical protein
MPIHWAAENLLTLHILQPIRVVGENLRDLEGANPEGVELVVFSFILPGGVPLKYQVPDLELFLPDLPVESLLDFFLVTMGCGPHLLSDLLHLYYLMNPSDHMICFSIIVLKEFCHR